MTRPGIEKAFEAAEEAAAYLAHCLHSVEYLAVEKACLAQGEEELELAAVCLATATRGILQTKPGRQFARHLVQDKTRLPASVLFRDDRPALAEEWFSRYRFAQRALLGLFGELLPAWNELQSKEAASALKIYREELVKADPFSGKEVSPGCAPASRRGPGCRRTSSTSP